MSARYATLVAAALVLAGAACAGRSADNPKPTAAPSFIRTAVGPVPGPDKSVARPANPYAGDAMVRADGRRLFVGMNCAGCHGEHAGGGMGPSLRDVDWIYGSADAQILSTIAEGRAHGMPSWGMKMTDDQLWKIVAYLKSLRTADEPEAPQP